ncbi:MAG: sugar ABC transporter permease [Alicyclobacillus sp.]|nr:sugar ABC transporter permease [Alicyclobacillus sp.]
MKVENTASTAASVPGPLERPRFWTYQRIEKLQGYLFVLPWMIGFLAFIAVPLGFSLVTSFADYNITSKLDFIGLQNYKDMFTADPLFWQSVYNTLYFVVISVPLNTAGAILLAVLLHQKVPGLRIFRTIYYLPSVLSGVAIYLLWQELLNPANGLVNRVLHWFGIPGPSWLFDPHWAKPALILMGLWGLGGGMLLYLNALQNVPAQLYEAAEIDGASTLQRFFRITLPMITPIIFFEVVTGMIGAFQVFQSAYVLTNNSSPGGPMNSLLFYNYLMWNKAFVEFKVGYANAMAWFLFVVVMIITVINLKLSKKWVYYEGADR